MLGGHFMLKTMIAVFSIPLVAHANIDIDIKPLKEFVVHQTVDEPVDTAQIRAAVKTISVTAQMNMASAEPVERIDGQKTDHEHLQELLANIDALSKQAEKQN